MMNDHDLDRLLSGLHEPLNQERLWNVRRSILVAAKPRGHGTFFLFRFQPVFFTATALLGLVLGISVPMLNTDDASTGFFDLPSQSFLAESFG